MSRFVVDAGAAVQVALDGVDIAADHKLLAPTLLRSQVLSILHERSAGGDMAAATAREALGGIRAMSIRLLGDAVLQRRAWEIADRLGWATTYSAEYVALTLLHGDALVTLDADLARQVRGLIKTVPIEALRQQSSGHLVAGVSVSH